MLGADKTITIVNILKEGHVSTVIRGVTWYEKSQTLPTESGLIVNRQVIIRIPIESLPNKPFIMPYECTLDTDFTRTFAVRPQKDFVFLGEIKEPGSLEEILKNHYSVSPILVKDNRMGLPDLQHIRIDAT